MDQHIGYAVMTDSGSVWSATGRWLRRRLQVLLSALILMVTVVAVVFGPQFWPIKADALDLMHVMQSPSAGHPMGTDNLGRDLLARAMFGGRISMAVGLATTLAMLLLGTCIGAFAGFYPGPIDSLLMRTTDLFLSLPQLPLLLLIIFLFRDSLRTSFGPELGIFMLVVAVIGGLNWMPTARIIRAEFRRTKEQPFVEAALAIGATDSHVMFRHILPNTMSPLIVSAVLGLGSALITESTLSFLGLGFPPDVPTWGRMLYDAYNYLELAPHMAIVPGALIFLTVLCLNYLGEALRDALDPTLRL